MYYNISLGCILQCVTYYMRWVTTSWTHSIMYYNVSLGTHQVQTAEEEFIVPDDEVEEEDSSSGRTSPELSLRDRILLKSTNKTRTDVGGGGGTKPKEKKPCVKKPRAKKNKPIIECDNSGSLFVPRAKPRPIVISSDESSGHELPSPPTKAFKTQRKPALDDSEVGTFLGSESFFYIEFDPNPVLMSNLIEVRRL